jgi:hypothetical protein
MVKKEQSVARHCYKASTPIKILLIGGYGPNKALK